MDLKESGTLKVLDKVRALQSNGVKVIQLDVGEPDFKTPENIITAAWQAMEKGLTHYTASSGIPELREAVASKLKKENGLDFSKENILMTPGSKQALFYAIMSLVDEGDEVIIPTPAWPSYMEMVTVAGGTVKLVPSTEGFKLNLEGIKDAVTEATKLILVNSPNNPTGYVAPKDELKTIAEVAADQGIYVLSDEIYEKMIYEGSHVSLGTFPGMDELAITINGFSKAYAMTGWRLGYAAAAKPVISAMNRLQQHSASCPASFVQWAGVEALRPETPVQPMIDEFRRRRDFICKALADLDVFDFGVPPGAFYIFPDISRTGVNAEALCDLLLERAGVSFTPGAPFGGFGKFIRISYANSMENLKEAVERIGRVLEPRKGHVA